MREHQKEVPPPVEPGKSLKNPADWGVMEIHYFSMPRSRSWHFARKTSCCRSTQVFSGISHLYRVQYISPPPLLFD
jgi:hypothetical protein